MAASCNMRPCIITCGCTLIHAATCKMRPHVITLTEGPIQPRKFEDQMCLLSNTLFTVRMRHYAFENMCCQGGKNLSDAALSSISPEKTKYKHQTQASIFK